MKTPHRHFYAIPTKSTSHRLSTAHYLASMNLTWVNCEMASFLLMRSKDKRMNDPQLDGMIYQVRTYWHQHNSLHTVYIDVFLYTIGIIFINAYDHSSYYYSLSMYLISQPYICQHTNEPGIEIDIKMRTYSNCNYSMYFYV